ncbi:MAG TPA: response regulator [Trueperaceae bacterium]
MSSSRTKPEGASEPYLLCVEDNADDCFLTRRTLARNDFPHAVVCVADGAQALEHVQHAATAPLAILLDSRLPKLDGHEVLLALRSDESTRRIPVLLLVGSFDETRKAWRETADACLLKPLDWQELDAELTRLGVLADGTPVIGNRAIGARV